MRELKILLVVLFFTGIVYFGVEPFAHSQMHPHTESANFDFAKGALSYEKHRVEEAQKSYTQAKEKFESTKNKDDEKAKNSAKQALDETIKKSKEVQAFWKEIAQIDFAKGDAAKGAEAFMNAGCIGCHGVKSQSMPAPMDNPTASSSFGVVPPDLSSAGYLYEPQYLAAFIKNPPLAAHIEHKFNENMPHPMPAFYGLGGDMNQELADMVAYLISIAPKKMDSKTAFEESCSRCHGVKYSNMPRTTQTEALSAYMGSNPPDLSMMIRAKSVDYLHKFINDPQKELPGTAMPRVGLKKHPQEQVVSYLEKAGDRKKAERESLGLKIMGFFVLLSLIGIVWKFAVWREVH